MTAERRRNRKVAKDQSTLTQLQAVIFPYGRHEAEIIGDSTDDEVFQEVRPKKRRKTDTKRRRRDDTLTQRHGFVRSASSFECEDSDQEVHDFEQRSRETTKHSIRGMKERMKAREAEDIRPTSLLPDVEDVDRKASLLHKSSHRTSPQDGSVTTSALGPPPGRSLAANPELRTPRKSVRFATERIIPSSQTPSDAGACTQRSSRYRDADRSPLKEKSQNVYELTPATCERADLEGRGSSNDSYAMRGADAVSNSSEAVRPSPTHVRVTTHEVQAAEDHDGLPVSAASIHEALDSPHGHTRQPTSNTKDSQYGSSITIESFAQPDRSPESQLTSRKMLDSTRRRLTYAKAQSAPATGPTPNEDPRRTSGKEPPVAPVGSKSRGLLQRISTIQDSDDEDSELDESEQASNTVNGESLPEGRNYTQYTLRNPSTYDPVNSALDRDAARFLRTQRTQTQERTACEARTQPSRSALLVTKTTVGDSDTDADDDVIEGEETTDDEVVEIAPQPAATEPDKQSSPETRTALRGHGESQCTFVGSDTLLGVFGDLDSQIRTQVPEIRGQADEIKHEDSEPAEHLVEESTHRATMPQIYDFATNTAASGDPYLGKQSLVSTRQLPREEPLLESLTETVAEVGDTDVVLSSQPNERRTVTGNEVGRPLVEVDRVPSSPPALRSSQISTVMPTQWSQAQLSIAGLQPAWLHKNNDITSQTIPSSPIQYPWSLTHSSGNFHRQTIGQSTQSNEIDGMERLQPVILSEFSLAPPPPEWQPGTLTMSSSPVVLPPAYVSQNAAPMPQIDS